MTSTNRVTTNGEHREARLPFELSPVDMRPTAVESGRQNVVSGSCAAPGWR